LSQRACFARYQVGLYTTTAISAQRIDIDLVFLSTEEGVTWVSNKLFGRSERKRSWGRSTRIDSWGRLQLVIDLMKCSLPIDITIDLDDAGVLGQSVLPLPCDPDSLANSVVIPTPLPFAAEVRVSLWIDETLAWLLPVQFCIDQLLTADEVITKLADAICFLKAWSQVHGREAREQLRRQRLKSRRSAKSTSKYLIQ